VSIASTEPGTGHPPHEPGDLMEIQMGPSHPASHGTIKFNL
jgi:NADH:ubiquinone oxidoreductase subunit D